MSPREKNVIYLSACDSIDLLVSIERKWCLQCVYVYSRIWELVNAQRQRSRLRLLQRSEERQFNLGNE